ncbi:MAG: hypothetical protein IPL03_00350 [Sterolibacteriaceae bacterium]|nr:hypothetical protein [Candidatus Methylophosphatis haderslevensis]
MVRVEGGTLVTDVDAGHPGGFLQVARRGFSADVAAAQGAKNPAGGSVEAGRWHNPVYLILCDYVPGASRFAAR